MTWRTTIRPVAAPDWLLGLWRRTSVEGEAVTAQERAKIVFWGQTRHAFVDLRVSPPGAADAGAPPEGFAGHVSFVNDHCTWHRAIDLAPGGPPDSARLVRKGDTLHETGVGYTETFRLAVAGRSRCAGFRTPDRDGILVLIDDHFLCAMVGPSGIEVSMGRTSDRWRIAHSTSPTGPDVRLFDENIVVPATGAIVGRHRGRPIRFEPLDGLADLGP
jgi:hypothetical protein